MNKPLIENDTQLIEIMEELDKALPRVVPPSLPIPVQRFCTEIDKNFTITAEALDATADLLEAAAKDLRSRAQDLRDASPDVRKHVEHWIKFEREANERGKFLATLFNK